MKFGYDPTTDSLYIELLPGGSVESEEIAEGFVVDFNDKGQVVGLDIEDASTKLDLSKIEWSPLPFSAAKAA